MPETIIDHQDLKKQTMVKYTAINSYFYFAFFLVNTILSPYIVHLGYSTRETAWFMSIYSLALIVFSPMIGTASDRYGRKIIVQGGFLSFALAMVMYLNGGYWFLVAGARILEAISVAAIMLVALARVEDTINDKNRGLKTGWALSFNYVAKLIAPLVAGLLVQYVFITTPFVIALSLSLFMAAFMMGIKDKRSADNKALAKFSVFNDIEEIKEFLAFKPLRGMAILGFVMHASNIILIIFLPLFITDNLRRSFSALGAALFVMGIMHLAQPYFGKLSDKYKIWQVITLGCLVVGICNLMLFFVDSFAALLIILFVSGIGGAIWNVSAWNLMSAIGERINKEGQIVTCYMSLAKVGAVVMSILAGFIIVWVSIQFLFLLSGLLILAGVVVAYPRLRPEK